MKIRLIKPLESEQASMLTRIGITVTPTELDIPDTRNTYCRQQGYNYSIYSNSDDTPVASLFIKNELWDRDQVVSVNQEQVESAEKKLESGSSSESRTLAYEERQRRVNGGDYTCLFETPFSELRFDEQNMTKQLLFCKFQNSFNSLAINV